jgi:hypothetical protein
VPGVNRPGVTSEEYDTMRRLGFSLAIAGTALALTAVTVLAAVTWHSGPTFTNNGDGTFTATGDGSGFGNQPAVATIVLNGTVRYTCVNKGGNAAQGQNPVPATTTGSQDLGNADHNGRGVLNLTVGPITASPTISGKVAGCPNGNWQGINPVFEGAKTATLTITQAGTLIFGPVTINY